MFFIDLGSMVEKGVLVGGMMSCLDRVLKYYC